MGELQNASNLLRYDRAILSRGFSNDARSSLDKADDILKKSPQHYHTEGRMRVCNSPIANTASATSFNHSYKAINPNCVMVIRAIVFFYLTRLPVILLSRHYCRRSRVVITASRLINVLGHNFLFICEISMKM